MRITCLVKRWQHHTSSGGYDHLASALGATIVKRHQLSRDMSRVSRKIWNILSNNTDYMEYYQFEDWFAEQQLLLRCLVAPPDLVHVLYADEQLDLLLRWRRLLRCPLVATFHRPARQFAKRFERFQTKEMKGIDAAIVLARSEISAFQGWLGADRVVCVPHGVDTKRFVPSDDPPSHNDLKLLIVGHHMRDWNVIHRVIDEVHLCNLAVQFDVVTPSEFFPYFTGCSNVSLRSDIGEAELIELYRGADALFLPVTGATANNAVLEALACGLPVITNDVGGMPDYVTGEAGWLCPNGSVEFMLALIKQLCANRDIARSRRAGARARACELDWQRITERLSVVYSAVCSGRSPSALVNEREQATEAHPAS
jgi:glycosyltransferase involved in cell wall biosynthesis